MIIIHVQGSTEHRVPVHYLSTWFSSIHLFRGGWNSLPGVRACRPTKFFSSIEAGVSLNWKYYPSASHGNQLQTVSSETETETGPTSNSAPDIQVHPFSSAFSNTPFNALLGSTAKYSPVSGTMNETRKKGRFFSHDSRL